jgi:ATP-binding cassette subfamily C protein LapB
LKGITGIFDLRAVLTRLNYRVTSSSRPIKQLTAEQFPCLLKVGQNVCVGLGPSGDGRLRVFSGEAQQTVNLDYSALKDAELFLIAEDDPTATSGFKHWSSRLFHRFRGTLTSIMAIGFLANLLALGLPLFVMNVYDKAIGAKSVSVLITLMIGIAVILCMDWLVKGTKSRLQAYLGARLDAVVANTTFRHFLHLPLPLTTSAPIGAQITRLKQFDGVREIFHGNLANALIDLPFSALFVVVLSLIGGPLALLPLGLLGLYIIAALLIVPRMKRAINLAGEAKSRVQNITVEILSKRDAIQNLSADDVWIDKFRALSADFAQKNLKTKHLSQIMQVISQMMMTLCGIGVLGFGAIMVMNQSLTQGALIAVMALVLARVEPDASGLPELLAAWPGPANDRTDQRSFEDRHGTATGQTPELASSVPRHGPLLQRCASLSGPPGTGLAEFLFASRTRRSRCDHWPKWIRENLSGSCDAGALPTTDGGSLGR